MRTVVLLCEHSPETGSFGLVLNRPFEQKVSDLSAGLKDLDMPLFYGGPVEPEVLSLLHGYPSEETGGGIPVLEGLCWGGPVTGILQQLHAGELDTGKVRLYLGYSGWSPGQLEDELNSNSWLTIQGSADLVLNPNPEGLWKAAVKKLDRRYHPIVSYPLDPRLN